MDMDRMLNIDPRQLEVLMRVPALASSPKAQEVAGYRRLTAKWSPEERLVYDAVQEGFTESSALPVATGLTEAQVGRALGTLVGRGVVRRIAESPAGGIKDATGIPIRRST